ncbi:MAG: DUF6382 domain-containing protein [Lachnospiraceae bacterium]|nr:DUF6382 domain-containing protein [Lachnospiraceae bacterium]
MGEARRENENGVEYLIYATSSEDKIDNTTLGMMTTNEYIPGLLPVLVTSMNNEETFRFDVSNLNTLDQVMEEPLKKRQVVNILNGIAEAVHSVNDYMMNSDCLELDPRSIFCEPRSCETYLVCIPVVHPRAKGRLENFLKGLISKITLDDSERTNYMSIVSNYLEKNEEIILSDFIRVINGGRPAPARTAAKRAIKDMTHEGTHLMGTSAERNRAMIQQEDNRVAEANAVSNQAINNTGNQGVDMNNGNNYQNPGFAIPGQNQNNQFGNDGFGNQMPQGNMPMGQSQMSQQPMQPAPQGVGSQNMDEKQMSYFWLLCHYSKANKEKYKAQQAKMKQKKAAQKNEAAGAQPISTDFSQQSQMTSQGQPVMQAQMPQQMPVQPQQVPMQPQMAAQGQPMMQAQMPQQMPVQPQQAAMQPQMAPQGQPMMQTRMPQQMPVQPQQAPMQTQMAPQGQPMMQTQMPQQMPVQPQQAPMQPQMAPQGQPMMQAQMPQQAAQPAYEGTTLLNETSSDTTILGGGADESHPFLIRVKTGEKIMIRKNSFVLGRDDRAADYSVSDNTAVSHIHAKIERKNDTYYLVDCGTTNRGSTNFTYLEDEQLQPMEEYALEDGMKIRLADEEFEFYLY